VICSSPMPAPAGMMSLSMQLSVIAYGHA